MSDMKSILSAFDSAVSSASQSVIATDANDMLSILRRLDESAKTESLDRNQKAAGQLSATFKPKTTAVLTAKTDPKNPMAGKLVGGCEEDVEHEVAEDLVVKMKRSLDDYLRGLDDKKTDDHIRSAAPDRDISQRVKIDRDLIPQSDPVKRAREIVKTQAPVHTVKIDDMTECGIYGDEDMGFEIRRGERVLPTRFKAIDHAIAAADMYAARRRQQNTNPDYREEK